MTMIMRTSSEDGQLLFELVMAIGLVATVVVAIVALSTSSVRNSTFAQNKSVSNRYAQEAIEWLAGEKALGWEYFKNQVETRLTDDPAYANVCFNALNWTTSATCPDNLKGIFKREGYFTCKVDLAGVQTITDCRDDDVNHIQVKVRVYWDEPQGTQETDLVTIFTRTQAL